MKKHLLTAILSMSSILCIAQQGIYYKAKYLISLRNATTGKIPLDATDLANFSDICTTSDVQVLVDSLNDNPFTAKDSYIKRTAAGSNVLQTITALAGGIDVTDLANNVSVFLIERAKQELTIAFFERFRKFSEKNPEFEILFPKTTNTLKSLLSFSYPQMLPALQTAFLDDLEKITEKIDNVMELPRYQALLENFPEIKICLRSIRIVRELEVGFSNTAEILLEFSVFPEWKSGNSTPGFKNAGSMLTVAAIFSESIRNDPAKSGTDNVWLTAKELKELVSDQILFNIYLSLVYQKIKHDNITFYDKDKGSHTFAGLIKSNTESIITFRSNLNEFFVLATQVNAVVKDIADKKASHTAITNDDYYNYINTSVDIVQGSVEIINSYVKTPIQLDIFPIVRKANDIFKDSYSKKYAQLFSDLVDEFDLISKVTDKRIDFTKLKDKSGITSYAGSEKKAVKKMTKNSAGFTAIEEKDIEAIQGDLERNINGDVSDALGHYRLKQLVHFLKELKPYGLFMANVISAKKPEDVQAAIENAVLPVGSSSVKKNTVSNLSVQAYLGAYLSDKDNSFSSWTSKFGVIAPIGISYTPGFLSWKSGGSIGLFGSLIDLSAIVDYNLKKDSTVIDNGTTNANAISKDYKIKLGQIFSPGLFVVYGFFGNLPLSIGAGGQYGPGLSKINVDNTAVINNPSWRWSVFLAVDIPLINLHNRVKIK
ncbi:hypothetical protein [Chitinophaga ginsengisoli]|uniref:Uncharacterized protein n=1 Tax=Chitinophaga ginsengisoli TaxID=363837 RepID=A0A2P8FQT3_9BACT|nr:hypothetical protein [Chitinophaga ginsengisoli]PSL24081.1 hypothetical protein CLV42_11667 [Chitinophaga ginsengisoli]